LKLKYAPFFMLFIAFSVFTGCAGGTNQIRVSGQPLVPLESMDPDISISASYMSPEDLIALVGESSNPFLHYQNRPLTVFRISVGDGRQAIRLFYDTFEMRHADEVQQPLSHRYIKRYWEGKLNSYSGNKTIHDWTSNRKTYSRWHPGKVTYNVNTYMVASAQPVEAGERYEGLVVFEGALPETGSVILVAPVYSDEGRPLRSYDFEYISTVRD